MADGRPLGLLALLAWSACAPAPPPPPADTEPPETPDAPVGAAFRDVDEDGVTADVDCDDHDPTRYPRATELRSDGVDQNCDGYDLCPVDLDGDGFADPVSVLAIPGDCATAPFAPADAPLDCDDQNPARWPGAPEIVGNEIDEDCDGAESCYVDADRDGTRTLEVVEVPLRPPRTCRAPAAPLEASLDCDDTQYGVAPGRSEVTGNVFDDDCDGWLTCHADADGDGLRARTELVLGLPADGCGGPGEALSSAGLDCDDHHVGPVTGLYEEPADNLDGDCDGRELCWRDADRDGFAAGLVQSLDLDCWDPGEAWSSKGDDCDDTDRGVNPDAFDRLSDGIDQDCDGHDACQLGQAGCPAGSCAELLAAGVTSSGHYWIVEPGGVDVEVVCDMTSDGGGWALAAIVYDDGIDHFGWNAGGWRVGTTTFGSLHGWGGDLRSAAMYLVGVHDLRFQHSRYPGTWATYDDVGDGTLPLDAWVDVHSADPCRPERFVMSRGTLAVAGDLCSTDLVISPAALGGGCDFATRTYGPTWHVGPGGTCPRGEPAAGSLGADRATPNVESRFLGFVEALGLGSATQNEGMRVWVR